MLPVKETEEMIHVCIQCSENVKCKSATATRHIERKHAATASFSYEKKKGLLLVYESKLS